MNNSKFLNIIYVVGAICVCLIVYVIVDSSTVLVHSNENKDNAVSYQYWENEAQTTSTQNNLTSTTGQESPAEDEIEHEENSQNSSTQMERITSQLILSFSSNTSASEEQLDEPAESNNQTSSKTTTSKPTASKPTEYTGIVNINTASFSQLCSLNGIGEVLAQRIIDYRKIKPFKTIEEIMDVSGIAQKKFAAIKDRIKV